MFIPVFFAYNVGFHSNGPPGGCFYCNLRLYASGRVESIGDECPTLGSFEKRRFRVGFAPWGVPSPEKSSGFVAQAGIGCEGGHTVCFGASLELFEKKCEL